MFLRTLGRRMVFAADEYYLMAGRPFPAAETYEGFDMHEDGIGMARTFEMEFTGQVDVPVGPQSGFFACGRRRAGRRISRAAQPGRRHRPARLRQPARRRHA